VAKGRSVPACLRVGGRIPDGLPLQTVSVGRARQGVKSERFRKTLKALKRVLTPDFIRSSNPLSTPSRMAYS